MFPEYAVLGGGLILLTCWHLPDWRRHLYVAVGLTVSATLALPLVSMATGPLRVTYDQALCHYDLALHLDTRILCRVLISHPWWWNAERIVYGSLPLMIGIVYCLTRSTRLAWSLGLASVLGPLIYLLVPAVGPAIAVQHFPFGSVVGSSFASIYPRNAFPSLHFAWSILLWVHCRGWLKPILFVYLILMAIATTGSGEHYAVDLLASIPFCIGVNYFVCTLDKF